MKMSVCVRTALLSLVVLSFPPDTSRAEHSGSNGVYGGYVGSDKWFDSMRQSAANRAMIQSLGQRGDRKKAGSGVPADQLEYSVVIKFPEGNHFPDHKLPDVRIVARDSKADAVTRAPYVDKTGSFYAVLKKGVTYDVYWFYPFGSKEKFGTIVADPKGPLKRHAVLEYRSPRKPDAAEASAEERGGQPTAAGEKNQLENGNAVSPRGSAEATAPYQPPESDKDYHAPEVGPGYQSPKVGAGYVGPQVGPGFKSPQTGGGYQRPEVGPGYQPPASR